MSSNKVSVFLPCRAGSQRVPKKNIKPFGGFSYGLLEIKLAQLIACDLVDEVVLSSNDDLVIEYAKSLECRKLNIHRRSEILSSNEASTDSLVKHALDLIPEGHILWTHVTSPFITSEVYSDIIEKYFDVLEEGYDSLMSTSKIQGFLWNSVGPINYDRVIEKWPRTQTIECLHEVNSAVFINDTINYGRYSDRIGVQPYLYDLDKITGFDIDWNEDFLIAECLCRAKLARV